MPQSSVCGETLASRCGLALPRHSRVQPRRGRMLAVRTLNQTPVSEEAASKSAVVQQNTDNRDKPSGWTLIATKGSSRQTITKQLNSNAVPFPFSKSTDKTDSQTLTKLRELAQTVTEASKKAKQAQMTVNTSQATMEDLRSKLDAIEKELQRTSENAELQGISTLFNITLPSLPRLSIPEIELEVAVEAEEEVVEQVQVLPIPQVEAEPQPQFFQPQPQLEPEPEPVRQFYEEPQQPAAPTIPSLGSIKPQGSGQEILLQGFNWESHKSNWYQVVGNQAEMIASMGISMVWLPPPTDSVSPEGYLPRDLYNLNSRYGSEEQLRECVRKLQSVGLKVIGDVVLNHRCAHQQDAKGIWNVFGGRMAWDARAIVSDDPNFHGKGNKSTGDCFHAAPNVDHSQEFVRKDICNWMNWLRENIGFDGWRLDFVRGFSGTAVREYMEHTSPQFAVGEYWDSLNYDWNGVLEFTQDAHRQRIINWLNAAGGTATAFDVTTKGILHAVFERTEYWRLKDAVGKPPGVMGWWPSRATTFLENHDTGSTQGHWRFPHHGLEQGYCYILTHPGTPTIFYDHLFEDNIRDCCRRLVALRKKNGLHCRSEIKIVKAERDVYAAEVDGKVLMKIGPGAYAVDASKWRRAEGGHHWEVYERK